MRFLQLLIGGLNDVLVDQYKIDAYQQAVSFACFGIFSNIATILILVESSFVMVSGTDLYLVALFESKLLWVLLLGLLFGGLVLAKGRIMAADRIQFSSRERRKYFLVSYYVLSFAALLGSYKFYSVV